MKNSNDSIETYQNRKISVFSFKKSKEVYFLKIFKKIGNRVLWSPKGLVRKIWALFSVAWVPPRIFFTDSYFLHLDILYRIMKAFLAKKFLNDSNKRRKWGTYLIFSEFWGILFIFCRHITLSMHQTAVNH